MTPEQVVDIVLERLGLHSQEERERFLHPDYERDLHDPFLLSGMSQAVERIARAIERKEKIAVYADFDADGIPASVVLFDFFKKIGHPVRVYIPHRDQEGYGFHPQAVETLAKEGVQLIITVDVGIADASAVARAAELGVDVIITDHHEPNGELSALEKQAVAVINPKKPNESYPFRELCGAGVAYKLVQALLAYGRKTKAPWTLAVPEGWEKWLLDMVAIATVADMVPLLGENRALAYWGLVVLRKTRRPGLAALARKAGFRLREATEDDIAFSIAPRINAAGRMDSPELAFSLLTETEQMMVDDIARELERLNRKRKGIVAAMVKELKEKVAHGKKSEPIVLGSPRYSPALCGLAAASLAREFGVTTCIWGKEGTGTYKGSCRSAGEVSVVRLFEAASKHLLGFGGHAGAGGFSVAFDTLHSLPDIFTEAYRRARTDPPEPQLQDTPFEIPLALVSHRLLAALEALRPFGVGNPKPRFVFRDLQVSSWRLFGKSSEHVEVALREGDGTCRGVAFFRAEWETHLKAAQYCRVTATVEKETWRNEVVLHIDELQTVDKTLS